MKNPTFGKWNRDDDYDDSYCNVSGDWLTSKGPSAFLWDLRAREKEKAPCTIKIGGYVLEKVIFPSRRVCEKVEELAMQAVETYGVKDAFSYPLPPYFNKRREHLIPLFRYYLIKTLLERG